VSKIVPLKYQIKPAINHGLKRLLGKDKSVSMFVAAPWQRVTEHVRALAHPCCEVCGVNVQHVSFRDAGQSHACTRSGITKSGTKW